MSFDWFSILMLVFQYGPELISWAKTLIDAIKEKNPDKGKSAVSEAAKMAADIVRSYQDRTDMGNDVKRELAWQDLVFQMSNVGVALSETNARTLVQAAYQHVSGK